MKKTITCSEGQRIFDKYPGTNAIISIKCSQKKCKKRRRCNKMQNIKLGNYHHLLANQFYKQRCPLCNAHVFDVAYGSNGTVEIKCKCNNIVDILFGNSKKTAFAA